MKDRPVPILITRPEAQSRKFESELLDRLGARITTIVSPLIEIKHRHVDANLDGFTGVIFTSSNGVLPAATLPKVPAYCVGEATTDVAKSQGWAAQMSGENADALVEALIVGGVKGPLMHLAGRNRVGQIAERLTSAGVQTQVLTVYDQVRKPLSQEALAALKVSERVIIPVFSPQTARNLMADWPLNAQAHIIALSPAVAAALNGQIDSDPIIVPHPTAFEVIREIEMLVATTTQG